MGRRRAHRAAVRAAPPPRAPHVGDRPPPARLSAPGRVRPRPPLRSVHGDARRHRRLGPHRPVPGRNLRGGAARPAARVHARAGLRGGVRLQGRAGEGLVRVARRRGRAAVLDVARGLRQAAARAAGRRRPGRRRGRLRLLPGLPHRVARVLVLGRAAAGGRRGRPAGPARAAPPAPARRGPVRAAEGAGAARAPALHRGRDGRVGQGPRRRVGRPAAARLGGTARLGASRPSRTATPRLRSGAH